MISECCQQDKLEYTFHTQITCVDFTKAPKYVFHGSIYSQKWRINDKFLNYDKMKDSKIGIYSYIFISVHKNFLLGKFAFFLVMFVNCHWCWSKKKCYSWKTRYRFRFLENILDDFKLSTIIFFNTIRLQFHSIVISRKALPMIQSWEEKMFCLKNWGKNVYFQLP